MQEILTEKYRPKTFADVVCLDPQIEKLVNSDDMPHMLFIGPPGTGKTTVAKVIIKHLGAEALILNASKDRGIETIRTKIEPFATKASDTIKIVFLDEFDATTPAFQTALRNFMETHSRTTRFITTCNYKNKIIDPLLSRFTQFHFYKYDKEKIIDRLSHIVTEENINISPDALTLLAKKYHDDIRGMINFLSKNKDREIKPEDIRNENLVLTILARIKKKEWLGLREQLLGEYLDYPNLIEEMDMVIFQHPSIDVNIKRKANILFAEYQWKMQMSFNKELCFAALLAELEEVL